MRNDYLQSARLVIEDPNILINVVSRRVKQLRMGSRALVQSLEKLSFEDVALREIAEGKISYELAEIVVNDIPDVSGPSNVRRERKVTPEVATT